MKRKSDEHDLSMDLQKKQHVEDFVKWPELKKARYDRGINWCWFTLETHEAIAIFRFHFERHPYIKLCEFIRANCELKLVLESHPTPDDCSLGTEIQETVTSFDPLNKFLQQTTGHDLRYHGVQFYRRLPSVHGSYICQVMEHLSCHSPRVFVSNKLDTVQHFVLEELMRNPMFPKRGPMVSLQFKLEDLYLAPPVGLLDHVRLQSPLDGKIQHLESELGIIKPTSVFKSFGLHVDGMTDLEIRQWLQEHEPIWLPDRLHQLHKLLELFPVLPSPLTRLIGQYAGPWLVMTMDLATTLPDIVPRQFILNQQDHVSLQRPILSKIVDVFTGMPFEHTTSQILFTGSDTSHGVSSHVQSVVGRHSEVPH